MSEEYWTVSEGLAVRNGNKCRECKEYINIKDPIVIRDGRKIRLFYHTRCFSGSADPRTQPNGAFSKDKFGGVLSPSAPKQKGYGKWSCRSYGYTPDYKVLSKITADTADTPGTKQNMKVNKSEQKVSDK